VNHINHFSADARSKYVLLPAAVSQPAVARPSLLARNR
jgi:hypothetical protein